MAATLISATPPPRTEVYLLQNRLNTFYTLAELELSERTLCCTLKQYSRWVERELEAEGLKERIEAGERVVAFEFRRDQLEVKWLKQFMGGGFWVRQGDSRKWLVSLIYPTTLWTMVDAIGGRAIHRQWKRALER